MIGYLILVILLLLVIFQAKFLWKYRSLRKLPGPFFFPFEAIYLITLLNKKNLLSLLYKNCQKYGTPSKIQLGPQMFLIIYDREGTEFFLRSRQFITKSREYHYLDPWLGKNGMLNSSGEVWQKTRKMITPAFHFQILEKHVKIFDSTCDVLIDILYKKVDKGIFDIYPNIVSFTTDIILETAMGIKLNSQLNPQSDFMDANHFMTNIIERRTFSLWKWNDFLYSFSSDYKKQQKAIKILDEFSLKIIRERRNFLKENEELRKKIEEEKPIFLDILFNSTIDGEPLSDEIIKIQTNNFVFGGHDTTASAISFTIFALANNIEIQNKVVDELRLIFGTNNNNQCTMQDLNDMKYTELVIKEVLRYYGIVPFFARELTEDVDYNGIKIPKNTTLFFFSYALHRDPTLFKDPFVFNPDRFLDESSMKPYSFIPFSAGPRGCLGQKYAMLEIKVTIARLLRHFEFLSAGPEYKVLKSPEIVMKSLNGINVQIRKRQF